VLNFTIAHFSLDNVLLFFTFRHYIIQQHEEIMNIKQLLLGSALASMMFAACSSDDSGTGASSGSCDVSALPASSLSFEKTDSGCYAQGTMDAVAFATYVANYSNAGWLPVTANPSPDGQGGEYVFSKTEGTVSHTVTLTGASGAVSVVYVKTGDASSNGGALDIPVNNASTCDLATAKLPPSELAWKPTFGGSCEVSQTISLASLQKFDTLLIAAGYKQTKISNESFRYTIEKPNMVASTIDRDTLLFTYSMETFVGTFSGVTEQMTARQILAYELNEVAKAHLPEDLYALGEIYGNAFEVSSVPSAVNSTYVANQLNKYGWNLKETISSTYTVDYEGSIVYNGAVYTMELTYFVLDSDDHYYITIEKK
jgi:hypothetical protein